MRASTRILVMVAVAAFVLPAAAFSRDPDHYSRERQSAYHDGYETGFREGLRHGEFDFRNRLKYNFRGRESERWGRGADWGFRFQGEYKRGYRDGYRRGYREGYRPHANPFGPYPQRRY